MILAVDFSLRCHHCGAKGPSGYSVEQAFILWNERTMNTDPASQIEDSGQKTDSVPRLEWTWCSGRISIGNPHPPVDVDSTPDWFFPPGGVFIPS